MSQIQEQRHVYYDCDLAIEAYNLSGIVQKFPIIFMNIMSLVLLKVANATFVVKVRIMK